MISQANISSSTPMGATLLPGGGATFRVWAPRALAVYLNGSFYGAEYEGQSEEFLMACDQNGYWTGFAEGAEDGHTYHFYVVGPGSSGYKRDPYARQLAVDHPFPTCCCIVRSAAYPWHDQGFVTPRFNDMIIYQIHVGTYALAGAGKDSTFLDVIGKIPYLVALGINVLQPLPIDEAETDPSMGYDGADYFSPDFDYVVSDPAALAQHLGVINGMLAGKGLSAISLSDITSGPGQLRALVDLCHVHGIAVAFDLVYNHAGGFTVNGGLDDQCIYYYDRVPNVGNNNDSLYFTDQDRGTGGLSFALWNNDVRQFLINNSIYYVQEFHADGFRYDEISGLLSMNRDTGWSFCRDLTSTLRFVKPGLLHNAEFWPGEFPDYSPPSSAIVASVADGGAGFDVLQHDGLRGALRDAVAASSNGRDAAIDFDRIAAALYPQGFAHAWQTVTCVENHDIVKVGTSQRLPVLADSSDPRSWYARSRARFAMAVLLTAPGLPQLFMGQEFLEEKQWSWDSHSAYLLSWTELNTGNDVAMVDHLRFTQDLIRLRWLQPALRGDAVHPFYVSNQDRVLAYHRWIEGTGQDVVVVATLSETTWHDYAIGFPLGGAWVEVFNSDVYDNWVNPVVAGNGGGVTASASEPLHGLPASAPVVIPANGVVVFARG